MNPGIIAREITARGLEQRPMLLPATCNNHLRADRITVSLFGQHESQLYPMAAIRHHIAEHAQWPADVAQEKVWRPIVIEVADCQAATHNGRPTERPLARRKI